MTENEIGKVVFDGGRFREFKRGLRDYPFVSLRLCVRIRIKNFVKQP